MSSWTERSTDPAFGHARRDATPERAAVTAQPPELSRTSQILAWLAIVAVFVALRGPFVSTPLERDEGEYAYIAQRALQGEVPYRDAFDQKPPGIFLIYAAIFMTAGQSIEAIHIGMYVWTLGAMVLLYRLVSRRAGQFAGLAAALALAVTTADPSFLGNAANTEIFMIGPLTGALLCLLPRTGPPGRLRVLAAGALGAAAFWIKPVAATNIAFLLLWLVWACLGEKPLKPAGRLAGAVGWFVLGGALATAPIAAYFVARGAFAHFVYCVFTFNSVYATNLAPPFRMVPAIFWSAVREMIPPLWPAVTLALLGLVSLSRRARADRILMCGWLAFSFAGVCIGGYFREHYFIQMLPAVAALVGLGLEWLRSLLAAVAHGGVRVAALAAVFGTLVLVPVAANRATAFAGSPELVARAIYGRNPFDYSTAIATDVGRMTAPADTVLIIGSEPQILFYAGRKSATRYIYMSPLAAASYPGLDRELRATLGEVERARPRVVVDVTRIGTSLLAGPRTDVEFFRTLQRTLAAQGVRPESFFMPLPVGTVGPGGTTFKVVDPYAVLEWERARQTRATGVMVLRRPDGPVGGAGAP